MDQGVLLLHIFQRNGHGIPEYKISKVFWLQFIQII